MCGGWWDGAVRVDGEGLGVCGVRGKGVPCNPSLLVERALLKLPLLNLTHTRGGHSVFSKCGCMSARSTVNTAEVASVANN